jgi:hypothetical protein
VLPLGSGIRSPGPGTTPEEGFVLPVVLGIVGLAVVVVVGAVVPVPVVSVVPRRQPVNIATTKIMVMIKIPAFFMNFLLFFWNSKLVFPERTLLHW